MHTYMKIENHFALPLWMVKSTSNVISHIFAYTDTYVHSHAYAGLSVRFLEGVLFKVCVCMCVCTFNAQAIPHCGICLNQKAPAQPNFIPT